MRFILSKLGDHMDENIGDDVIKLLDSDNTGFINAAEYSKLCFGIKDDSAKKGKGKGKGDGKKGKKKKKK